MPEEELIVGSIITDKGAEKLVQAGKEGKKIDLKYLVIGDGNGEFYKPTPDQTALKNLCWQGEITSYEISPNDSKQLIIKGLVPSDVGHFFMREIGVLDSEGDLIAVSNTSAVEFIPYTSGEILNMDITFYVQFRSAEIGAVNIVVNPTDQEKFKEEILTEVKSMISEIQVEIEAITNEEIDEITGTPVHIGTVVGEPLSGDDIARLLDDDPSNDPVFEEVSTGALSDEDIDKILGE